MKAAIGSTGPIFLALLLSSSAWMAESESKFIPIADTCENLGLVKATSHAAQYFCTKKLQASVPDVDCSTINYEVVRAAMQFDTSTSWDKYAATIAVTDKDKNCLIAFSSNIFAFPDSDPMVNEIQVAKCQDVEYKGTCTRAIMDGPEEKEKEGEAQGGPEGGASESAMEDLGYDAGGEKDGETNTDLDSDARGNVDDTASEVESSSEEAGNSTMNWLDSVFDIETPVQGNSFERAGNTTDAEEELVDEEIEVWEEEIEDGLLQVANVTAEDNATEAFWEAENATTAGSKETHAVDSEEDIPASQNTTDINLSDLLEEDTRYGDSETKNASAKAENTTEAEQEGETHEISWDAGSDNSTDINFDEEDSRNGEPEMMNATDEEGPYIQADAEAAPESETESSNASDQDSDNTTTGLTGESSNNESENPESGGDEVNAEEAEKIEAEEALLEELEEDLFVEDESLWEFAGKTEECSRFGVAEAEGIVFKCGLTAYVCGKSLQFREKFLLLLEETIIDGCELGETNEILSSHSECDAFPSNEHYLKLDGTHKGSKKVVCPNGLPLSSYYMFCSKELDNYYCDGDRCEACEEIERNRRFLRH